MPSDRERGGLVGVKRPLVEAAPVTDRAAERTVLPPEVAVDPVPPSAEPEVTDVRRESFTAAPPPELTKPATFHLPIGLLQRLRTTSRLKNTTMVEFVRQAIEEALQKQKPTEEEIRRLLS